MYLADSDIGESDLPPQFRGNLWTADEKQLVEAIEEADTGQVQKTANGYRTNLASMTVNVTLGRIEETECNGQDTLIALPANEFFDDDCIHDSHSALGAFMQHHFKENIAEIKALVRGALAGEPSKEVRKKPGEVAASYGIGKCVFLDHPLSSDLRLALVAVTKQRADVGLYADASFIFEAAEALQRLMANNRLTRLHIPILGSGHGGLRAEVSLVCMLIALGELHRKRSGRTIKDVNVVVFRHEAKSAPSISESSIKRALVFASRFFAD